MAQGQSFPGTLDVPFALDLLSRMVRIRSYSATAGEAEIIAFMAERMKELGLETELQPVEAGRCNAIGRWRGTGGGASLMLNGHLDTNPPGEGWTVDPLGGLVDEKFVYGLGVSNMKAGVASYLCAIKTLADRGFRPRGDILVTGVVGELQGGVGTLKVLESGLRADWFLCAEPTDLRAVTMHVGAVNFVIELSGATRHVSNRAEGADALAAACRLVDRINRATFSGARTADQRRLNCGHVGVLRAGLTREFHEWRPAQVADFARLVGTARFAAGQTEAGVLADLAKMADEVAAEVPGLRASVATDGRPALPPFEVPSDSPIVAAVNRAYRAVRGHDQPTGPLAPPCFYVTDAAHLRRAGMAGLVCGPGGRYNTRPDERVDIDDYLDMIRIWTLTIHDLCGAG